MDGKEFISILFGRQLMELDEETRQKIITSRIRLGAEVVVTIALSVLIFIIGTAQEGNIKVLIPAEILLLLMAFLVIRSELAMVRERIENYQILRSHKELLDFMRVVRSQRHDFNLHVQAIANMIRSGDYEKCQEYMGTFMRSVSRTNEALLVSDPAVAALLSTYFEYGQSKNIDMQFDICHDMAGAVLQGYQMNTIIGNLLQNAIDETETHKEPEERWILMYVMKRGRKLLIKISNPFHGDIAELDHAFDMGYSTKKYHEGVGLSNVKRLLALHKGSIGIEYRDEVISVIAQIPLNIL